MGFVKDYFSFSKRERTGAIVLVILIGVIFALPEFIPSSKKHEQLQMLRDLSDNADSLSRKNGDSSLDVVSNRGLMNRPKKFGENQGLASPGLLFEFDPNTISEEEWLKLGISQRTAATIKKFLAKGGSFKKPEDIGKIYGFSLTHYNRLLPYVRIQARSIKDLVGDNRFRADRTMKISHRSSPGILDINTADTSMLIALPGIGSTLANRIVSFRTKLGGFYSIDQLKEVYGLTDSTYEMIRPLLAISPAIHEININEVTVEQLKAHPYVKWNIANAIINYRTQHGPFKKMEDLLRIEIITPGILERLKPYLVKME